MDGATWFMLGFYVIGSNEIYTTIQYYKLLQLC